jgi:hypothetical protein
MVTPIPFMPGRITDIDDRHAHLFYLLHRKQPESNIGTQVHCFLSCRLVALALTNI